MTDQQQLLVSLDGSGLAEAALPYAEAIAQALGGTLHLFAVAEREPGGIFVLDQEIRDQLERTRRQELSDYLATLVRGSRERGVYATTEIVAGDPAGEILAAADRIAASMIVMATHGRGGLQRSFLGSVADKVMRTASHPTLLISPGEHHLAQQEIQPISLRRIAVPLDGSPLAEAALGLAGTLAAATGAQVLLVRVQSLPLTSTMAYPYIPDLGAVEAGLERDTLQYLEGIRSRLPDGITTEIAVLRGERAVALAECLREKAVDLVVMTTHGYGGAQRLLVGSTADRLVRLEFPVLLIRAAKQTS